MNSGALLHCGVSTQSICGSCNAFRRSSHQLETPPSQGRRELPPSVRDPPSLQPLPTQGSHPNGYFPVISRICNVAMADIMRPMPAVPLESPTKLCPSSPPSPPCLVAQVVASRNREGKEQLCPLCRVTDKPAENFSQNCKIK